MGNLRVLVVNNGSPCANVKVCGQWGFMSFTNDFYTDSNGWAEVTWSSSSDLTKLFIGGRELPGNHFPNGGSIRYVKP